MRFASVRGTAFLLVLALGACGAPSPATTPAVTAITVSAPPSSVPGSRTAKPDAATAAAPPPAPSPATAKPIELPSAACVVEADAPGAGKPGALGLSHIYVAGASVASVGSLGKVAHVRLLFPEGTPEMAALAFESDLVSVRGEAPTRAGSTDDLDLYPRTRVVRDGWLDYVTVRVVSARGASLEPKTELPPWLTPSATFAQARFDVPCAELTPFGAPAGVENDAALSGQAVALEDDAKRKAATIDASPGTHHDGLPVRILATAKGRTKIRFEAGRYTHAEGWVASPHVKKTAWGGIGYGTGSGRLGALKQIRCESETPLWVEVRGTTFAWGVLKPSRTLKGNLGPDGAFRLSVGGSAETAPFVPKASLAGCRIDQG